MLGNGRLEAACIDGVKRLCHIRGKMRKKVWVNTVSLLLQIILLSSFKVDNGTKQLSDTPVLQLKHIHVISFHLLSHHNTPMPEVKTNTCATMHEALGLAVARAGRYHSCRA